MTYDPNPGDEIRFAAATPFQRKYVYRVEEVNDVSVRVSVETGFFSPDADDRFTYDIARSVFDSLAPEPFSGERVSMREEFKAWKANRTDSENA